MLKAFSLGSPTSLTTLRRLHIQKCFPRQISRKVAPKTRSTQGATSVIRVQNFRNEEGEGIVRERPPHHEVTSGDLHAPQEQRNGPHPVQKSSEKEGVERAEAPSSRFNTERDDVYDDVVMQGPSFITGKSRYHLPLLAVDGGKFRYRNRYLPSHLQRPITETSDTEDARTEEEIVAEYPDIHFYRRLHILATSQSFTQAWEAYDELSQMPTPKGQVPKIPYQHLHRLCRLLVRHHPRTRNQFLRLLSILYTLRLSGGTIHAFEWNALIHHAGATLGTTKPDEFKLALDLFDEMTSGSTPGSTFSPTQFPPLHDTDPIEPDLVSYNSLLDIAARTSHGRAVRRASNLLQSSGTPPDRITHLTLLKYFTISAQMSGVRVTLSKMREQGLELGLDGVTHCIWAYSKDGRLDIVQLIYRVLRYNLLDGSYGKDGEDCPPEVQEALDTLSQKDIFITQDMRPTEVTFHAIIQVMAYHGDFHATISVLLDMVASDNIELYAPLARGPEDAVEERQEPRYAKYAPTYTVFRAIFLGFARHGTDDPDVETWTFKNLHVIFMDFMRFSETIRPSRRQIYWILLAFDKTSGHDVEIMREAWLQLEEYYGDDWGNRLARLRTIVFSDEAEEYLSTTGFRVTSPGEDIRRRR